MGYEIGDRVYVKLSDAPEYRGLIVGTTETHFLVEDRNGHRAWIERARCSYHPKTR